MKLYKIFSDIHFIKGYNRTLVFDGLRDNLYFLPNIEADDILTSDTRIINENHNMVPFLLDKELIFELNPIFIKSFPKINQEWESAYLIGTLIIELNQNTLNLSHLWEDNPYIGQIHFVFQHDLSDNVLTSLCDSLNNVISDTIEFTFCDENSINWINDFLHKTSDIQRLVILNDIPKSCKSNIAYAKAFVQDNDAKYKNISLSIDLYFESKLFHPFFNNKIIISKYCEIKRDINDVISFHKLKKNDSFDTILDIFKSKKFKEFSHIIKEESEICGICEFRRNCIDIRIPKIKQKRVYFESECHYNPYISKWIHEEGYLPLTQCGVISNEHEFSIDHEKIALINKELWGDE